MASLKPRKELAPRLALLTVIMCRLTVLTDVFPTRRDVSAPNLCIYTLLSPSDSSICGI